MSSMLTRLIAGIVLFAAATAAPSVALGEWTFVPPATVGESEDIFTAVDGTDADDVWAAGLWENPNAQCLIEHFDGVSWTKLPVPAVGSSERLKGILAVSRDHALAVGYKTSFNTAQPIAVEWNGAAWAQIPVPEFPAGRRFTAIDQTPGGEIWVAGSQAGSGFLARRTGGDWSFEIAPPFADRMSRFFGMHAAADDQVWVVGSSEDGMGGFRILIHRYDGNSSWTVFDIPTPGLDIDRLWGVHSSAPDDVWAVGEYYHPVSLSTQPLIMHFDGTAWTHLELPDYPEGPAHLRAIAARAPDDIYAAGTYGLGPSPALPRPFMLHYDDVTWSDVVLPPTGGVAEWFLGMAAIPNGDVWAVGQYSDGASMEPMAFRNPMATTAVGERQAAGPAAVLLSVPNPFQSQTSAHLTLDRPGLVRLGVLDVSGRLVRRLVLSEFGAGPHVFPWDGLDSNGRPVPAGIYFYDLDVGGQTARQKVIRVR